MKPYYDEGGVTIYHGDCRQVLPNLTGDAIVTDPPYGVNIDYGDRSQDSAEAWRTLMIDVVPSIRMVAPFAVLPSCRILELPWIYANFAPDWLICWHKGSPGTSARIGFNDWEPLLVYGRPPSPMHDYFSVVPDPHTNGHPCAKPVAWASWLVSRGSAPGGLVIDPFAGSGTTLVAARQLGRRAIGIEIEERYCEVAAKRLAQHALPLW